ncbi:transaldolase [Longilinea arvoryzae]|uniref:Transaldolase n=1 Tax=Longilinea arvoryzae TaxID=360412 RepID=A0A0S7B7R0_9CHLR|nr:transaldolase family protein [Longilinea arvoryzae]GAP13287.1 transaldolase [Longilinea arvoryzae]
MPFYLDSATPEDARMAARLGWVTGATTNPRILANCGLPPEQALAMLAKTLPHGPIFYQLTAPDLAGMQEEAARAAEILGARLILKIPAHEPGFEAAAHLSIIYSVAITGIYDASQAMVAAACGAKFAIAYYHRALGRLEDGIGMMRAFVDVLRGTDTLPLAASLKNPEEVVDARRLGFTHLTMPLEVLRSLSEHPASQQAIAEFNSEGIGLHD